VTAQDDAGQDGALPPAVVPTITIRFLPDDPTEPIIECGPETMTGHVYAAAWLLDQMGREMRQGQLLARAQLQAQRQAEVQMVAQLMAQAGRGRPELVR
jgi:hypothetical protein